MAGKIRFLQEIKTGETFNQNQVKLTDGMFEYLKNSKYEVPDINLNKVYSNDEDLFLFLHTQSSHSLVLLKKTQSYFAKLMPPMRYRQHIPPLSILTSNRSQRISSVT